MIRIQESQEVTGSIAQRDSRLAEAIAVVAPMLDDIRKRGDAAVFDYARKFDQFAGSSFRVAAAASLSPALAEAIEIAAANIRDYARCQVPQSRMVEHADGRKLGQIVRPLDSAGVYIPAGRFPLISTLLMTAIPAQAAGVERIVVACPNPVAEILGTARYLQLPEVWQIGGAQAIGAMAFGTETIPKVDLIAGPGNIYVAAAKKLVAGEVKIDFVAGPTEIVIIAAEGNPKWIAADMLAQAEHDVDASSILLTTSRSLAEAVAQEIDKQLETLPTAAIARVSIEKNGLIVLVDSMEHAMEISNQLAPEHLSLHDPSLLAGIKHAGSVFLGAWSTEAAGDYASGPNHVLPTSGAARMYGGLSAADFVKVISVQELSREALAKLASAITTLARAEGLEAHARSVEARND